MKSVNYVSIVHAQGYVLLISFALQVVTGVLLLMMYRVTDDQFGFLCSLIANAMFNWVVANVHSFGVNLVFSRFQGYGV